MKKLSTITYILLFSSLLILTRCSSGSSDNSDQTNSLLALSYVSYEDIAPIESIYTDPTFLGYDYEHISIPEQEAGQNVSFDYTFDTNFNTKDIFFIFSNISPGDSSTYPLLSSTQSISQGAVPETASKPKSLVTGSQTTKGKPEISEFNRRPYAFLNKINPVNMLLNLATYTEPMYDQAGSDPSTGTFKIDVYSSIDATCKTVVSDVATSYSPKTLNVWVADDCLTTNGGPVTQPMVTDLADAFLTTGDDNDIYDWVTNIYGEEWGSVSSDVDPQGILIAPDNEITILLLDIDNDRSANSGVLGYFWAKDNFKSSYISYSNQRIMFYMDAYLYANHPDEIISALAHEFQHMIHFYEKTVLLTDGNGTETWIDEMCSMVTEDLVAEKLHVDGPRGVPYNTIPLGSAGTNGNTSGRLPTYIYYNDDSVTAWYSGNTVLRSYSINYALGAYLARTYGGAEFFHNVIQNNYTDYQAIEYALEQYPSSTTKKFGDILARWGVAGLISDYTTTTGDYEYNSGAWYPYIYNLINYKLGSINLYNYRAVDSYGNTVQDGPYFYSESNPMPSWSMPAASNQYYKAASDLTGPQTWHIKLRNNVRMTVLARDPRP